MFNERRLRDFVARFPDHRVEIVGSVVDGAVVWEAAIIGPDGEDVDVAVADVTCARLRDVPCMLADSLRHRLGAAQQVKDKSTLPASQRMALEEGIPGVVRHRGERKPIVPTPPMGAREG